MSGGQLFGDAAQQAAQFRQFAVGNSARRHGTQLPMFEKCSQPQGVCKMLRAFPEAIPFFTVGQVDPGRCGPEPLGLKNVVLCHCCNGLK